MKIKNESHAQAIRRICLKWRFEKFSSGYVPIFSLINRLQTEERKRRLRAGENEKN